VKVLTVLNVVAFFGLVVTSVTYHSPWHQINLQCINAQYTNPPPLCLIIMMAMSLFVFMSCR